MKTINYDFKRSQIVDQGMRKMYLIVINRFNFSLILHRKVYLLLFLY